MNQRPKCPTCLNDGWIAYAGTLVCGECLLKVYKAKNEKKFKELQDATS